MVFCPEQLLRVILAHIHYMPDHWQGNAHRYETRDQFSQLFQYKAVSMKTKMKFSVTTLNNFKAMNLSIQCALTALGQPTRCYFGDGSKCIQATVYVFAPLQFYYDN